MSTISDALAAMDKATLLREKLSKIHNTADHAQILLDLQSAEYSIGISTKPALAWIKEALPVVMGRAGEIRDDLDPIFGASKYNDPELRAEDEAYLARLDALIAREKPEEVGR